MRNKKLRAITGILAAASIFTLAGSVHAGASVLREEKNYTAAAQTGISEEEALEIAREDAGLSADEIDRSRVKLEYDDGWLTYEVEFYSGNSEYDYEIDADTGEILGKDYEIEEAFHQSYQIGEAEISEKEALEIAREDAQLTEDEISRARVKLDYDDGILEYDVEFYAGDQEYDYKIDAESGKILEKDFEIEEDFRNSEGSRSSEAVISEEEALNIAREDAGLSEDEIGRTRISLDYDDGILKYDVEFYADNTEYDYEIDANTGKILSKDYEIDDDFNSSYNGETSVISQEEATQIALERVPGASETDIRIKLDYDDGRAIYEGDILYENVEYEFEINAETGMLISWESDSVWD